MKTILRFALPLAVIPTLALAVYAPIPEQEQGKPLTYRLGASVYSDSNIFGGATGVIDSIVYNFNGAISYNGSISDQTFASASYEISNDYVVDRPGLKNLTSHALSGRLAHKFSDASDIDLNLGYNIAKNPQSLLAGVPLNTDQSFKRLEFDGKFNTTAGQKTGVTTKYRYIDSRYDNANLATNLDHTENLLGLELSYALLPQTKLVGEYRYQVISYATAGSLKDKTSNFFMVGADYNPTQDVMMSGRAGLESRNRDSASDTTAPYVELSSHYNYTEGSFLSVGYTYTFDEPSDVVRFTDTQVNRFFVNVQHRLSGTITASGSVTYEPSRLQGRGGVQVDIDETTTRVGLGLSWLPTKNWAVTSTYDHDKVNSDDPSRGQNRDRFGVAARLTF
jgi:hypothetical protein